MNKIQLHSTFLEFNKLYLDPFNKSKYLVGIAMIIFNIGSKFLVMDISKSYESLLKSKIVRRLTLFSIFFVATRDIVISFVLTATFIILTMNLFNDESKFCILPNSFKDNVYTEEEYELAKKIIKGYETSTYN